MCGDMLAGTGSLCDGPRRILWGLSGSEGVPEERAAVTWPERWHSRSKSTYSFSLLNMPNPTFAGFPSGPSWNFSLHRLSKSLDRWWLTWGDTAGSSRGTGATPAASSRGQRCFPKKCHPAPGSGRRGRGLQPGRDASDRCPVSMLALAWDTPQSPCVQHFLSPEAEKNMAAVCCPSTSPGAVFACGVNRGCEGLHCPVDGLR